ncbi:GNAT family N-acetyltransferase [Nocardioides rubriscoriae]|uniref:GNAT family N-acetyltransferase n=1 Tax=Nocardioides rubriscoriae TaxID=642762 RepID=UPI0011DFD7BC|nr:GNAT family N-acetyltransferase [Nocardioides rubriscoriae]
MPDATDLLTAYDTQLRGIAEVADADAFAQVGPLWRAVHRDRGFVTYEDLAGHDVAWLVAATVAFFRDETDVPTFEWKTRGHDDLPELEAALRAGGLVPEEVETVMVGEATALAVDVPLREPLSVRRLRTPAEMAAVDAVSQAVFGRGGDLAEQVARGEGRVEAWGAFDGEQAVSSGRLVVVDGTDFAGLWGGATLPTHRGLGLYRALTAARARSALARGVRFLQSDCTVMSRPILERSGLVAVTTTTPWVWTRPR